MQLITCETWDQYRSWLAHIKGATALLQLRGQEQLTYERGGQLHTQLRSQLVSLLPLIFLSLIEA
jgi:hypothetical protein